MHRKHPTNEVKPSSIVPSLRLRFRCLALLLAAGAWAIASTGYGSLYIQGLGASQSVNSPRYDRYYSGTDKAFIGQAYDWSGVGLSSTGWWATMISPTYFVSANHAHPVGGNTVTFYTDNTVSTPHTYTVDSWHQSLGGDMYLGRLTAAIPAIDNITYYPIPQLTTNSMYVGREIYVVGKSGSYAATGASGRVGRNNITAVPGDGVLGVDMTYAYNTYGNSPTTGDDEAYLIGGDSSGPSFTLINGALSVIGTHHANSSTVYNGAVSYDSFVPNYISRMNEVMDLFSGEHVTVVHEVPEPSSALLAAVAALSLLLVGRRRK